LFKEERQGPVGMDRRRAAKMVRELEHLCYVERLREFIEL